MRPAVVFPYTLHHGYPAPIVPIELRSPAGWRQFWVYADSGASFRLGPYQLQAAIGFSPRLGVGFNLLGRKDFFERFDVTFSDSRRQIHFKPVR